MNTDHSQFTSFDWTDRLKKAKTEISLSAIARKRLPATHGRQTRYLNNILIQRLWRSLKYECVYLHALETGSQARAGVGRWFTL